MQPPEAASMRQAAVFVDTRGNASCVPRGSARKSKRYQSDGSRLDLTFARSVAFCLSDCIRFVRRTRNKQVANFACGIGLRQSGAVSITHSFFDIFRGGKLGTKLE